MFSSPAFFVAYQVQIGLVKVRKCRETRPSLCLDNYDLLQYLVLSNMGQFAAKISLKLKVAPRSNIALLIKIQWVSKLLLTNGLLLSFIHSDSIDKIFVLTEAIICSALEKKNRYSMHHLILTKIIEGKSQNPLGDSITIRDRSSITNCSTFFSFAVCPYVGKSQVSHMEHVYVFWLIKNSNSKHELCIKMCIYYFTNFWMIIVG